MRHSDGMDDGDLDASDADIAAWDGWLEDALDRQFRALAHTCRRYLLEMLDVGGASAGDLTASAGAAFGLSRSRVTEHLRELAEAGLVRVTPEGPYRWYSLVDGAAAGVVRFIVARGLNSPG